MEKIFNIIDKFYTWLNRHDLDIVIMASFIGALIYSFRKKLTLINFFKLWFMASFLGYGTFKAMLFYFPNMPIELTVFIVSGVSGFSYLIFDSVEMLMQTIFDTLKKIITDLADIAKTFINNKINK